ncbi:hypothetical protein GCM10027160_02340 [Streptomyces calidiresistens]
MQGRGAPQAGHFPRRGPQPPGTGPGVAGAVHRGPRRPHRDDRASRVPAGPAPPMSVLRHPLMLRPALPAPDAPSIMSLGYPRGRR